MASVSGRPGLRLAARLAEAQALLCIDRIDDCAAALQAAAALAAELPESTQSGSEAAMLLHLGLLQVGQYLRQGRPEALGEPSVSKAQVGRSRGSRSCCTACSDASPDAPQPVTSNQIKAAWASKKDTLAAHFNSFNVGGLWRNGSQTAASDRGFIPADMAGAERRCPGLRLDDPTVGDRLLPLVPGQHGQTRRRPGLGGAAVLLREEEGCLWRGRAACFSLEGCAHDC